MTGVMYKRRCREKDKHVREIYSEVQTFLFWLHDVTFLWAFLYFSRNEKHHMKEYWYLRENKIEWYVLMFNCLRLYVLLFRFYFTFQLVGLCCFYLVSNPRPGTILNHVFSILFCALENGNAILETRFLDTTNSLKKTEWSSLMFHINENTRRNEKTTFKYLKKSFKT